MTELLAEPDDSKTEIWLEFTEAGLNGGTWTRLWEKFDTSRDAISFALWLSRQKPGRQWRIVTEQWKLESRSTNDISLDDF